ncbi:motility associated factor glycosyltransferase family protein [Pseudoalteromonas sp. NZS37]|uniref:motility associated factor glycosyltransferase family protein n=1 Tax=Pseudoalteromonas sp. NZS37 TaxID=2792071 RepID=UPI0018CD229B|nr:6-hydroxymethylpterin diphosphokinase MptE-like protein [Pseudoalteromonas sp. NZS37]MBG9989604.1 motility associated factor glycosyltransferase family protein [Pseudoalteromonas sp. NZS37]
MNDLTLAINEKLEELERYQSFLQTQIENRKKYEVKLKDFIRPDFDLEKMFQSNMLAFESIYPDIYNTFLNYQLSRFELHMEDGKVNVYDTKEKVNLYKHDIYQDSYVQYLSFQENPVVLKNKFSVREKISDGFIHSHFLNELAINLKQQSEQKKSNRLPKVLPTLMLMGIGCGYHIHSILSDHIVKKLYIYEPHIDLLYLSLFLTDWSHIFEQLNVNNTELHFSVGEFDTELGISKEVESVFQRFGRFFSGYSFLYKHYHDDYLDRVTKQLSQQFVGNILGFGFYDDAILSIENFSKNFDVPFLRPDSLEKLKDIPVFLIANGPSLDKDIQWLIEHQDNAIIISCGTALSALHQYGLKPDFHCEMERCQVTHDVLASFYDKEFFSDITLLALNTVLPSVFAMFEDKVQGVKWGEASSKIFVQGLGLKEKPALLVNCNPTVSNCALAFCEKIGFTDITLFGVDMGYKSEQHHSKNSVYYKGDQDSGLYKHKAKYKLKGNFDPDTFVETDEIFKYSHSVLERTLAQNPHLKIKNCSDGACVEGAKPTQTDSLVSTPIKNKAALFSNIADKIKSSETYTNDAFAAIHNDVPLFLDLCNLFIEQLSSQPASINAVLEVLDEQLRRLSSFHNTTISYFDELLRGTLLHTHSMLINSLYSDQDEQLAINNYYTSAQIVCNYLEAIKENYTAKFS